MRTFREHLNEKAEGKEVPETAIRANLQRLGFSKRNLETLARKMKKYKGNPVHYDPKTDKIYYTEG